MKNVMKRAWEIARKGQEKFGGKVSEYLSEALKMAWAEVKENEKVTMEEIAETIKRKLHNAQVDVWERYGKRRIYVNKGFKKCIAMLEFDDNDNYIGEKFDSLDVFGARQAGWEDEFLVIKEIVDQVA